MNFRFSSNVELHWLFGAVLATRCVRTKRSARQVVLSACLEPSIGIAQPLCRAFSNKLLLSLQGDNLIDLLECCLREYVVDYCSCNPHLWLFRYKIIAVEH